MGGRKRTNLFMTQHSNIPDAETRKREVEQLRASNCQLELVSLALDEVIAMVEADLRQQRRRRLEGKRSPTTQQTNPQNSLN